MGWSNVVKVVPSLLKAGGSAIEFTAKNWKGIGMGVLGWKYFVQDESLLEQVTDVAVGSDASASLREKGLVGGIKSVTFGSEGVDKSVAENVVDGVVREGTYQQLVETAGAVTDKAGEIIHAAGDGVQQIASGAGNLVNRTISGNGSQQLYNTYQQQAVTQQNQGNGLLSLLNPFNSIGNAIGSIMNGGTGLSLAAMIPAAYLMFGNFGWLGKIASLMLGSLAMKNINQQQMSAPQYQQGYTMQPQQAISPMQRNEYNPDSAYNDNRDEDNNVVHRGRGI